MICKFCGRDETHLRYDPITCEPIGCIGCMPEKAAIQTDNNVLSEIAHRSPAYELSMPYILHGVDISIRYIYPFDGSYTLGWKKQIGDELYGGYITVKNGEFASVGQAMAEYFPLMEDEIAYTVAGLQEKKLNEMKNDAENT